MHGLRNPIDDAVAGLWPDAARRPGFLPYPTIPLPPQFAAAYGMYPAFAKLPPINMIQAENPKDMKISMNVKSLPTQTQSSFVVTGTPVANWASLGVGHNAPVFETHARNTAPEKGSKPRRKYTTCRRSVRAWTEEEHKKFLEGLEKFRTEDTQAMKDNGELSVGLGPGIAEVIAVFIGTRSVTQVRSHAQKYFQRLRREQNKASHSE